MQQKPADRIALISEGLQLVAENVAALDLGIEALNETKTKRGSWVLASQADEEAAKALILLDFVRLDPRIQKTVARQLRCFHQHLARCIYVEMTEMSPADFREVRRIVESMRPSHYLDGPNDVDWIFRTNCLLSASGSYTSTLNPKITGCAGLRPQRMLSSASVAPLSRIRNLVRSFARLGLFSIAGLTLVAELWSDQEIDDDTRWTEIVALNCDLAKSLADDASRLLPPSRVTSKDWSMNGDFRWDPLTSLNWKCRRRRYARSRPDGLQYDPP